MNELRGFKKKIGLCFTDKTKIGREEGDEENNDYHEDTS